MDLYPSLSTPPDLGRRSLRRGDTLYYAGDPAPSLYRLDSGLLRAVRLTPQGRTLTLRHIRPGDVFGEEVLHGIPRGQQVTALTDATLTPLHPQHFGPGELWEVTRSLSTQLQRMMTDGVHIQDGELRERIARYLLNLADSSLGGAHRDGTRYVRATHELIAEGTGATRESVSKLIGEMRDDGLLTPAYRCLTLTDEAGLRALCGDQGE
ncbi:cyclic nucleotide-binding domain-containing protein [Deinococcus metallilatus]|uniref:CRP-like cAMP-binding protein n=2 Tax=Deinococcus TaxID=1298 RepID=A0AAJ5F6Z3_9DEIO|nr:cyclic nucleotide-binding domain-containing protein [Deinococcus metallilatus]MBB5296556.1 CRP-like cAMP-binding protein [Deinococcus metallilatus]QBY08417.1 cyclic nucleotide-binding domain-containing protein [Deinococcus metallilatus]RXJ11216.1 cyclic nucleotide-binding domain-containing protein [Deinococcus metallilatus]TLK24707.1 cyclic nucleotide-binding domain-containing protein [Deinococcus metallilatus]GMA17474.1 Crp/Fnr family transcriptional regulator [Deinococcus metallilatus]